VIWVPNQVFEKSDSEGRDLERESPFRFWASHRAQLNVEIREAAVSRRSPNRFVHGNLKLAQHIRDSHQTLRVVINLRGCFLVHTLHQPSSINFDTALSEKRGVVHKAS
jgi:hypothetical protein